MELPKVLPFPLCCCFFHFSCFKYLKLPLYSFLSKTLFFIVLHQYTAAAKWHIIESGAWTKFLHWPATEMIRCYCTFKVKMDSLKRGKLPMWGDCCMKEGWSSNTKKDAGSALLLAVCFLLWLRYTVCCLPFWKMLCSYFFRHAVLQEITKIYRTSCRSKAEKFAFGE